MLTNPSLMTFASASQFHIYSPFTMDYRLFSIVSVLIVS